jgi:hypothetical protein
LEKIFKKSVPGWWYLKSHLYGPYGLLTHASE